MFQTNKINNTVSSILGPKLTIDGDIHVDGDLLKDIIVVKNNNFDCQQCGGGDIVWLKNPGINLLKKGHYWESKKITSDFPSAYSLELFDVDVDGIDDIIATQWMGMHSDRRSLAWFRNPGKVYITEWEKTVIDGENGFLVSARNIVALVKAMEKFILKPELIPRMGKLSRKIAEEKYDIHKVNSLIITVMKSKHGYVGN